MSKAGYAEYPWCILVRHVRFRVEQRGFRTREVTLATTLIDAEIYSAEELAELFRRRWLVEIHIGSLKPQIQMNHLRCKSPQMVHKEIYCHLIGYIMVRAAILASALRFAGCPVKLSFKVAMQAVEEFAPTLRLRSGLWAAQWENLLATIHELRVGNRPGRREPRVVKRRQKRCKLIRKPRQEYASHYHAAA
jgi:hypothetical protein